MIKPLSDYEPEKAYQSTGKGVFQCTLPGLRDEISQGAEKKSGKAICIIDRCKKCHGERRHSAKRFKLRKAKPCKREESYTKIITKIFFLYFFIEIKIQLGGVAEGYILFLCFHNNLPFSLVVFDYRQYDNYSFRLNRKKSKSVIERYLLLSSGCDIILGSYFSGKKM